MPHRRPAIHTLVLPGLVSVVLALAAPSGPALAAGKAARKPAPNPYTACMALARRAPEQAIKRSHALWKAGDRDASRHCLATALLAMGRAAEAAKVLNGLARDVRDAPAAQRAELWAQAARAWLDASRPDKAEAAFTKALELTPDDARLRIERAVARGAEGHDWEALDDLNRAVELAPRNATARVLRGAAYRRVGAPDLAIENLQEALRLDPGDADAWLELGLVHRGQGKRTAARQAFARAIALDPRGATGQAARAALARLDRPATK